MSIEADLCISNMDRNNNNTIMGNHHCLRGVNLPPMELSADGRDADNSTLELQISSASSSPSATSSSPLSVYSLSDSVPYTTRELSPENGVDLKANEFSNTVTPTCEFVIPGVYLSRNFIDWKEDKLRMRNFKHIIIIDKHIQELYYPNNSCQRRRTKRHSLIKLTTLALNDPIEDDYASVAEEEEDDEDEEVVAGGNGGGGEGGLRSTKKRCGPLDFNSQEFNVLNLNFGENAYLTTVLPNCYRAVRFISRAMTARQSSDGILVIDCNGSDQKCLTITLAYLMYEHNITFSDAFSRLKQTYKNADLDRFYISQLYEYEPILKVQRAQSCGHSCSREKHAAILKRKKGVVVSDDQYNGTAAHRNHQVSTNSSGGDEGGGGENAGGQQLTTNNAIAQHDMMPPLTCQQIPPVEASIPSRMKRMNNGTFVPHSKLPGISDTVSPEFLSNINPLHQFNPPAHMDEDVIVDELEGVGEAKQQGLATAPANNINRNMAASPPLIVSQCRSPIEWKNNGHDHYSHTKYSIDDYAME